MNEDVSSPISQEERFAAVRRELEQAAAAGGHRIEWNDFGVLEKRGADGWTDGFDGWCHQGGRWHARALVWEDDCTFVWQLGEPTDPCPGAEQ